jgi:hypothetical protein
MALPGPGICSSCRDAPRRRGGGRCKGCDAEYHRRRRERLKGQTKRIAELESALRRACATIELLKQRILVLQRRDGF